MKWRNDAGTDIGKITKDGRVTAPNLTELVVNGKDRGAMGDGVADDSSAIYAAVAAASAAGGGTVYLPAGTFRVASRIGLKTRVNIKGAGRGATVIKAAAGVTSAVLLGASGDAVSDATYEDFTIDGDYTASSVAIGQAIQITTGQRCQFRRLLIRDTARSAVSLASHTDARIEACEVARNGLDGNTEGHSIVLNAAHRTQIVDLIASGGLGMCVSLTGSTLGAQVAGGRLTNATSPTGFEAIGVAAGSNCLRVSNVRIVDAKDNGISISSDRCTVTGCTIDGAENSPISVLGNDNTITGNVCAKGGHEVSATTYAGITVSGSRNAITGNRCFDSQATKTQDYGVLERVTGDYKPGDWQRPGRKHDSVEECRRNEFDRREQYRVDGGAAPIGVAPPNAYGRSAAANSGLSPRE
ncbi:hypothetical protein GS979_14340 [Rhodococcus hoagii]|nr:hypothetical protein [Prescottella equi]